ncbi:hypothetical protein DY000_02044979 [Brassica cretica]|uniref:Uncharacterized protein n=1 Tax=Brassica cretica TaxID=69181 RepID=A0ABQ7F1U5_BRACR|nr:hypothetical protein DY000_02044979 [Brassica cretica]
MIVSKRDLGHPADRSGLFRLDPVMETEHVENNASEFLSAESSESKKLSPPCLSPRTPYILAPRDIEEEESTLLELSLLSFSGEDRILCGQHRTSNGRGRRLGAPFLHPVNYIVIAFSVHLFLFIFSGEEAESQMTKGKRDLGHPAVRIGPSRIEPAWRFLVCYLYHHEKRNGRSSAFSLRLRVRESSWWFLTTVLTLAHGGLLDAVWPSLTPASHLSHGGRLAF